MLLVMSWLSEKNKPTLTMARTRSMRAPRPAVFSRAVSKAGIEFSYREAQRGAQAGKPRGPTRSPILQ